MNLYLKYLLFGLLPFFPAIGYSQIFLKGKVTDNSGAPLQNARIAADSPAIETFSDAQGNFSFENLSAGFYLFTVEYPGHSPGYYPMDLESDTSLTEYWVPGIPVQELEALVVTASHHGQKKIETLPAEIVGRSFLRKNAEGSLMQTLARLPGIASMNIGSSGSKPQIRGLGFNRVAVIENGIKHEGQQWGADHGLEIDQYNAERIEIAKGPASFMYGSDALGGVINIRSAAVPSPYTSGGSIDLSGKSNNLSFGGSVNLYTRRKNWFVNGRLTYMDYSDFRVPADTIYSYSYAVNLDRHFVRNTAGREFDQSLSTGYIGEKGQSVFYLGHTFHKSGFFANAHGLEPRNVDDELHDASNRDIQLPHQQVSHFKMINQSHLDIGRHRLAADVGYQRNLRSESGHYVNHGYMPPTYPQTMDSPEDLERKFDKETVSLQLKDRFFAGRHEISMGFDGEWQFNEIGGWGFLIPAFRQLGIGGFVYDKYPLSENLGIQGALRYDFGQIRVKEYRDWFESLVDRSGKLEREYLQ